MKRLLCIVLLLVFVFALACCDAKKSTSSKDEEITTPKETAEKVEKQEPVDIKEEMFPKISSTFIYATGVGAWGETLTISADGSFVGEYHDSDKGSFAPEYMMGTVYKSEYSGVFNDIEKVNDYTYKLSYGALDYVVAPGTEKIADDFKYSYTNSRGLGKTNEVYLYTPDTQVSVLPQVYRDWVVDYCYKKIDDTLGFYGIFNEEAVACFISDNV